LERSALARKFLQRLAMDRNRLLELARPALALPERPGCLGINKHKMKEPEMSGRRFGALVRREREAKEIGLREMAKTIGVSPTYLSKVERDEFPPPRRRQGEANR
jgi:DNA-binding XRE family transcriptional regulator